MSNVDALLQDLEETLCQLATAGYIATAVLTKDGSQMEISGRVLVNLPTQDLAKAVRLH